MTEAQTNDTTNTTTNDTTATRDAASARGREALFELRDVSKDFVLRNVWGARTGVVHAIRHADFSILRGETLALVGESGSGKSTLGRCLLQLEEVTSGSILYHGVNLTKLSPRQRRPHQRSMQIVYQNPFSSLDPTCTALEQVLEPLLLSPGADGDEARARAAAALEQVGIPASEHGKLPRAFSGGQRQRIGIARAIAVHPEFIMCDEPLSGLDMSTRAQVALLMRDLQRRLGLTYLFITHDLASVRQLADRAVVMYRGHIAEIASMDDLFRDPRHPYTIRLLDSTFTADPAQARALLARTSPRPAPPFAWPDGEELHDVGNGHLVAATA